MTKEQLAKRYKEIEAKRINDDIVVVELFDDKENPVFHSRLIFAYNKLYYTSCGYGFIFGCDIKHILTFFRGDEINPGYWMQKCEAEESPIIEEDVNLEKLKQLVCKYLENEGFLSTTSEKYDFEAFFDSLDTFWYEVADRLSGFLSGLAIDDADSIASSFVWDSRDFSPRYLYACEVIQWVENHLEEWLSGNQESSKSDETFFIDDIDLTDILKDDEEAKAVLSGKTRNLEKIECQS